MPGMAKRKNNPNQPELPIEGAPKETGKTSSGGQPGAAESTAKTPADGDSAAGKAKRSKNGVENGNGNGATHVLAERVAPVAPAHPFKPGKIDLPLHRRVDRGF